MIVSPALAALVADRTVRVGALVMFDFLSGPMRVWGGFGDIETGGHVWSGLGELGSVSAIELPHNGSAPETTFTLSGVDPTLLAAALASRAETYDRDVVVWLQHFDATWAPVDAPVPIYFGRMDVMTAKTTDAKSRIVEVKAEWLFARRAIPAFASLSDRDQQARAAGDLGAAYVASMQSKTVVFPV
jgi:hypothetical protein